MSIVTSTTSVATDRASLIRDAVATFTVTKATMLKRGASIAALRADGMNPGQIAAALGKGAGKVAPAVSGVRFYLRAFDLAEGAGLLTPEGFDLTWGVVTRGKGISDEDLAAVLVKGDLAASRKAVAALRAERKEIEETAAAAERIERKGNEAAAEAGAMAAPAVSAPDFGAMVAAIVGKATTPESRRRAAAALMAGLETLNAAEREARAARKAPVAA